ARGAVTMPEEGSDAFVYTPYENKIGKDSFTYVAVDAVGNASAPAVVTLKISKAGTKVTYADMPGLPAYKAAIRLAEEGIFVGECIGGQHFFSPNAPVSRSEFIAMTMKASGLDALPDISTTGFADDLMIPTWARAYAASALKSGMVLGAADPEGRIVFNATNTITRAEATVLLDRALRITDVSAETMLPGGEIAPVWAAQSTANLQTCGILYPDSTGTLGLSAPLNRSDAAQLVLGALEVLDARDDGGWFHW
ncbi:MAG: S-layer homology domain-containing protein, partial [Pseudoflavonifractor sp.]